MMVSTTKHKAASAAAMNAVFGTAELLEDILLTAVLRGMTPQKLLLAQRVSTSWKATIEGSPVLQKLLGFRPINTTDDFELFREWSSDYIPIDDPHWSIRRRRIAPNSTEDGETKQFRTFDHPLCGTTLSAHGVPNFPVAGKDGLRHSRDLDIGEMLDEFHIEAYEFWNQPSSSMHRVLLQQPAPVSVVLRYTDQNGADKAKIVDNEKGVTLGDIWQAGMHIDTVGDQKIDCKLDEYKFSPDVVARLVDFWAQTGVYDSDSDSDSMYGFCVDDYDREYDYDESDYWSEAEYAWDDDEG